MRHLIAAALLLALPACSFSTADDEQDAGADAGANATTDNLADTMASDDDGLERDKALDIPDSEERPIMQAQVVLDRRGFGPGVIDGKMGLSTENALSGFQEANGLEVTGKLDEKTKQALAQWERIPATRVVRIPEDWGQLEYQDVPEKPEEQAKMERLGYESLDEKLAERFHTTVEVLEMLNPGGKPAGMKQTAANEAGTRASASASPSPSPSQKASPSPTASPTSTSSPTSESEDTSSSQQSKFAAGQLIRVPNIGGDRISRGAVEDPNWQQTLQMLGVGTDQPKVERVVVSKSEKTLKAYDAEDKLVALFTVTSGSEHDPLPLGNWKITGVGRNPTFSFNPELFWDVPDSEEKQQLPPGPNGPVGVVWIDLSKEHYGIHGTPEPQTIGRAQSHGCVRLTNWDAARLAQMVDTGTEVVFEA